MLDETTRSIGHVYLVGAGPGDPGLIALRAIELLRRADVVLYDYLVNPLVLAYAETTAELICQGRHGHGRLMDQAEVNACIVEYARQGKTVVRLKSGDPTIFARIAEELGALDEAGIPYEIVPGITAAMAAASYAGIPVTHRDYSSSVALVTGHEQSDGDGSKLDYAALANFPGTLVFYMGVTSSHEWTSQLVAGGCPADTPAVILRRCSWTDQQTWNCSLGSVAETVDRENIRPPVLVIIGEVCRHAAGSQWFAGRPLIGRSVLVTRPRQQSISMCRRLEELGAGCMIQPAIEIQPPNDWQPVDEALDDLATYNWVVFSSANGVRSFMDRLCLRGGDLRSLGAVKLAVIGPRTAEQLELYHLRPDVTPNEYRAEELAAALSPQARGQRFLLARASRGREVLAQQLSAAGGQVDQIVVYNSVDVSTSHELVAEAMAQGNIHWTTVTSSAIARSLVKMFGDDLKNSQLASISPITTNTLREIGFDVAAEATEYTSDGVVDAILRAG